MESQKLENAYVTGTMTYEALAAANGQSLQQVQKLGRAGNWHQKRQEYRRGQKESIQSGELQTLMDTAVMLCRVLEEMVQNTDQFHLHLRTVRTKSKDERGETVEDSVPETVWLDKVDISAVQAVSKVLRELTDVIRDIRELPTQQQKHAQRLAEEKMALMREQSEQTPGGFGIQLSQEVEEFAE